MMSKLGIHVVQGPRNGYGEFVSAKPAVVLSVDDGGVLLEAKTKSNGHTVTIFRDTSVYLEAPPEANSGDVPLAIIAATHYYPQLRAVWLKNIANYYTITNEQGGNDPDVYRSLVAYEHRIMEMANEDGIQCVMLNLAGGSPGDFNVWAEICFPLIEWGAMYGHVYGRHAYGGGDLSVPDGNSNRPMGEADYLADKGCDVDIYVTEAGIDGGWGYGGDDRLSQQLIAYDNLLADYKNIKGFCGWTLGDWEGANCQSALHLLTNYLITAPTPPDPPPSGDCKGYPRVQYNRRYILLPPSATNDWYKAVVDGWGISPMTIGPSADDSGIGDLDQKEAWVVNPHLWGTGLTEDWYNQYYPGTSFVPIIASTPSQLTAIIKSMLENPIPPDPPQDIVVEYGIHDEPGAEWGMDNGVEGYSIYSVALGTTATTIDFSQLQNAGIKMIVRLNYGYGSTGTVPNPSDLEKVDGFVGACVQTIRNSRGVWGWVIANETNNPSEFPDGEYITPQYLVSIYNKIYNQKQYDARISPPAVDPYYGPSSDNREYWRNIVENIEGADFLTYHPKTQDSNPANVDSNAKFTDEPLKWQYLHLKSYQPLMAVVPEYLKLVPVIMTEVNPQRKQNGDLGWEPSLGPEWVKRVGAHFKEFNKTSLTKVHGVIFYRWDFDQWAINNLPDVLKAIKEL